QGPGVDLSLMLADDPPFRIDEDQRWPGANRVLGPDVEVDVIDHRVLDIVALDRAPQAAAGPLGRELCRMHPDDDQCVRKLPLDLPQLGKQMEAIYSAVGPEIEDHELAAQIGEPQRPLGVEPLEIVRELGRSYYAARPAAVRHPLLQSGLPAGISRFRDHA